MLKLGDFWTSIIIPSYAYTYIKINFLKNLIIDDATLRKLKAINDIHIFIESIKRYYPSIEIKDYTIEEIEGALINNYILVVGKIILFSPLNMRSFLKKYLMKFEIQNLKTIIISLVLGRNKDETRKDINFLAEEYLDNTDFIEDVLKATTLEEIQILMKRTPYKIPIREGLLYLREKKEIFVLEAFLDQLYYKQLQSQTQNLTKKENIMISLFVKYKTEIYNLNLIYRGIRNNIERSLLRQFLVHNYLFLDEGKIEYLLNLTNPDDFVLTIKAFFKEIKETRPVFSEYTINQEQLIRSIEEFYITYYFKKFKIKIDDIAYYTISKILEVLIKKEKEIRFEILPNVIKIIHKRFKILETM
ncbi:MAG: V-type ATPase subunit [Promethearchaeota archaeon]